jgi:predicted AAA+ superfamily ATPase
MNGQTINFTNIGTDAQVKRTTVVGYFEVLTDTLIASLLPAYQAKAKVKEVQTPKFYLFDCGVVNALSKSFHLEIADAQKGFLLETLIYHELRATNKAMNWGAEIFYWATAHSEIDFIIKRGNEIIAIEVKYSKRWKPDFSKSLHIFKESIKVKRCIGIYNGVDSFKKDGIEIYPIKYFLQEILGQFF